MILKVPIQRNMAEVSLKRIYEWGKKLVVKVRSIRKDSKFKDFTLLFLSYLKLLYYNSYFKITQYSKMTVTILITFYSHHFREILT